MTHVVKYPYVVVILACAETIFVSQVLGPFETSDQAFEAGLRACSVTEGMVEEDEYGRYCTESGDPLFSVDLLHGAGG